MPDFFAQMQLKDITYLRVISYQWRSCDESLDREPVRSGREPVQGEFSIEDDHEVILDILRRARDAWESAQARFDDAHEVYNAIPDDKVPPDSRWDACLAVLTGELTAARMHFMALIRWTRLFDEDPDKSFSEMVKTGNWAGWTLDIDGVHYTVTRPDSFPDDSTVPNLITVEGGRVAHACDFGGPMS